MPARRVYAPPELKPLKDDLMVMHRIRDLRFQAPEKEAVKISEGVFVEE